MSAILEAESDEQPPPPKEDTEVLSCNSSSDGRRREDNALVARHRRLSVNPEVFTKAVTSIPNWAPPLAKEIKLWRKLFALQENLLAVYLCNVRFRLWLRGKIYISTGHVCFQGFAVVLQKASFRIPFEEIETVEHGGICEMQKHHTEHRATLRFRRPILLKGSKGPVSSLDLWGCEQGAATIAMLLDVTRSDVEALDFDSDDNLFMSESMDTGSGPRRTTMFAEEEGPFLDLFEEFIPMMSLEALAKEIASDQWSEDTAMMEYFSRQGASEVSEPTWVDDEWNGRIAEFAWRMPVPPAPMCPRSTAQSATFHFLIDPPNYLAARRGSVAGSGSSFSADDRGSLGSAGFASNSNGSGGSSSSSPRGPLRTYQLTGFTPSQRLRSRSPTVPREGKPRRRTGSPSVSGSPGSSRSPPVSPRAASGGLPSFGPDPEGAVDVQSITIESSIVSHDVPFGNNFFVQQRTKLELYQDGVKMVSHYRIHFVSSVGFLKSKISVAAKDGCFAAAQDLAAVVRKRSLSVTIPPVGVSTL